ncbi:O-antigen ligase family protein [candidate division KSB1 bacterium]|nr:O-antigen ligase family protein [candidate division KSB1 bacterium]
MEVAIRMKRWNLSQWILFSLTFGLGLVGGLIFMRLTRFPVVYLIILEAAGILISLIFYFRQVKAFTLAILTITLTINIDKSFFYVTGHTGGVGGLVISAWTLMILVLYGIWFIETQMKKAAPVQYFPSLMIPLLILVLIGAFSMLKATDIRFSLYQLFQLLQVILLFFYTANNIKSEKDYKFVLTFLFITFLIELGIGFYQHIVNDFVNLGIFADAKPHRHRIIGNKEVMAVSGTTSGSHRFASYVIMILPLLLSSILTDKRWRQRFIYLSLLVSGLIILVYTYSRGGWVGFVVGMLVFLLLKVAQSEKRGNTVLQVVFLMILVVGILFQFKDDIFLRITGEDYGSARSRIPMMQIAFEIIKANPFLGVGLNNYTLVMSTYDFTGITYTYQQPVHNTYLQLAAEVGIWGLITFAGLLIILFWRAIQTQRRSDVFFQNQMVGLISGAVGLLVHNTMNNGTIDSESFVLFWFLAGLMVAISNMTFPDRT